MIIHKARRIISLEEFTIPQASAILYHYDLWLVNGYDKEFKKSSNFSTTTENVILKVYSSCFFVKMSYESASVKPRWCTFSSNIMIQWNLDLRKPDLRKNLDLRKIVDTTDFLVHKLFDLRKIFEGLMFDLRKIFPQKVVKIGTFWQFQSNF